MHDVDWIAIICISSKQLQYPNCGVKSQSCTLYTPWLHCLHKDRSCSALPQVVNENFDPTEWPENQTFRNFLSPQPVLTINLTCNNFLSSSKNGFVLSSMPLFCPWLPIGFQLSSHLMSLFMIDWMNLNMVAINTDNKEGWKLTISSYRQGGRERIWRYVI